MERCNGDAILAYAVTCSAVRQRRNEEAISDAEAMVRWLGDRGKSNFEKFFVFATAHELLLSSVTLLIRLIMHRDIHAE
jgi:hypothetical protein